MHKYSDIRFDTFVTLFPLESLVGVWLMAINRSVVVPQKLYLTVHCLYCISLIRCHCYYFLCCLFMCGYCSRSANIQGWQELPIVWLLFESGVHSVYTIIGVGDTSTSTHTVYMCIAMCLHVCMFVCLHLCVCVSVYSRQGCLTSQLYAYIHVHNRAIVIKD